ncbi:MAG TPA: protein kinase [Thermoanaerobaculia bacterium]|nr:protein kinase [Thermoanaerobaculia bacterium]
MITKGASVGPYEILSPIGAGGMGEVWRARDRRIGRDVAMKVLTPDAGLSEDMVRRFEQEARAAGALNHPGLVTIFDVGTTGSAPYIVMELLDGETVREAIDKAAPHPLPMRRVIDYVIQIAEALAVAHEKGIIHRDLKPENLFITGRRVKILDFGLAKLAEATQGSDRKHTGRHLTSAGMVVGTPAYMSPEQVRALPLDHRTDIFSLGSVMYEMLTGKSPFERDSAIETMHTVMSAEVPSLTTVVPELPASLEAIVRHCMEKDPRERFQSARDLAFQLRLLPETQNSYAESRRLRPLRPSRWRLMTAIGATALVLAASGYALMRSRAASAAEEVPVRTFRQLTFGDGVELTPSLSPDGKSFAFVSARSGNRDIYVQRVDGRTATNLTVDSLDDDFDPAFSPDGAQIAFRSNRDGGGIFVMGVTGESVRRLTEGDGYSPSWSPDGKRIVFSTAAVDFRPHVRGGNGGLRIVDVATGAARVIVEAGKGGPDFGRDSDAAQPSWSPHGKRIAFWGVSTLAGQRDLWTIDPYAKEPKRTVVRVTSDLSTHWSPVWSPDGQYLYFGSDRDGTLNLWRIPMDEDTGTPAGPAEPMSLPAPITGFYAFAHDGSLAFSTAARSYRLVSYPFNPATGTAGPASVLFGGSEEPLTFEASPDGKSMAFTTGGGAQEDLFVANIDGTRVRQLTNDPFRDRGVTWAPDGKTLYFYSNRDGTYHIWSIRADGSELTRVTSEADFRAVGANNIYIPDVSPDGRTLVARTDSACVFVHLDRPAGQRLEIFGEKNATRNPQWSPDGKKVLVALINNDGPGFAVYDVATKKFDKLWDKEITARWLPDSRHIAMFGGTRIDIIDIVTRSVKSSEFRADFGDVPYGTRVAADGTSFYGRQALEQGDIWFAPAPKGGRTSSAMTTP